MLGAIIGDTIGSRFEGRRRNIHTKEFELFVKDWSHPTDDSVMTIAVADAILQWKGGADQSYEKLSELAAKSMRKWGNRYFHGFGKSFKAWLLDETMGPYNSCGNGAAMRISPVGYAAETLEECIAMSKAVTEITHNHPDGLMGAEATAVQIFLVKNNMLSEKHSMDDLRKYEEEHYYPIDFDMKWLHDNYTWSCFCDMTCQPAYLSLYVSTGYEDAIRNAIHLGGDSDTIAAITGGIAEAYWGIPVDIQREGWSYLYDDEKDVIDRFYRKFIDK